MSAEIEGWADGPTPSGLSYADEGSIAHKLAATCLNELTDCGQYVGQIVVEQDYPHSDISPSILHRRMPCPGSAVLEGQEEFTPRTYSCAISADMARDTQVYVDNIRTYAQGARIFWVEAWLDLSQYLGHDREGQPRGGKGDVIIVTTDYELQAHDLKFGRGVKVYAERNEQAMGYVLGAYLLLRAVDPDTASRITSFRGVIHQPRIDARPEEYQFSFQELMRFAASLHVAADRVEEAKQHTGDMQSFQEQYLKAGVKQCRFCTAKTSCPELERASVTALFTPEIASQIAMDPFPYPEYTPADGAEPTNEKLAELGALLELVEHWKKAVRGLIEKRVLAGEHIAGFKIVQGKKGDRAWIDEEITLSQLRAIRMKKEDMYTQKLKSPTQIEQLLKKQRPGVWKKLQHNITQAPGKPSVAYEEDPRQAYTSSAQAEEFDAVDEPLAQHVETEVFNHVDRMMARVGTDDPGAAEWDEDRGEWVYPGDVEDTGDDPVSVDNLLLPGD